MEICNKEYVNTQHLKDYQEYQRELKYIVAKEARDYKKLAERKKSR